MYVFDYISGPNQAIGLKLAPNSQANFYLLGFRQAESHPDAKYRKKI